ncbi:MAG: glycosyltransferase [Proteiniphilum sp.]|nr:glycosyltransferase [Proteiniphilum sp.]
MDITENTLVSVIVVAYQSDKFILETLDSIRLQTWRNIELIITDDASTDKTVQICSDWLIQHKNCFANTEILTVSHNTGIPANCNRGLNAARGSWVKFIGADDILLESCIDDNMKAINNNPKTSFVLSDLIEINVDGEILRISPKNDGLNYFMRNQKTKKRQLKSYARWPAFLNTPTFFLKREIIQDAFKSDYDFKIFEDTISIFNIINKGAKILYIKTPTVKYRIHDKAISRNTKINDIREKEAYLIFNKYRKKYLSMFNIIDLSVIYESWIRFKFKGINGHKGELILQKLSFFYWLLKFNKYRENISKYFLDFTKPNIKYKRYELEK